MTGRASGALGYRRSRYGDRPRQADPRRHRRHLGPALGRRRHLPLRPHAPAARRSSPSTPRRSRCRARSTSATSSASPTPTPWPASSACGASRSSTRWAGTTTACRPSVGCRSTSACAATRRCPTTPRSRPRRHPARSRCPSAGATSSSCASGSPPSTSRPSRTSGERLGLSVDWRHYYTTIDERSRRTSQVGVPAQPGPGRGLPAGRADPLGRRRPHRRGSGRDGGPGDPRRVPPLGLPPRRRRGRHRHRHHPAGAGGVVRRPRRPSRRRALPVAVRRHGHHAALRGRGARRGPRPRRPGEGHGRRHDLHLRRRHRRHVVARAATCRRGPSSAATAASPRRRPDWITTDAGRPAYAELAGQTVKQAQARIVELLRRVAASCSASPGRSPTPSSSTSGAPARSRSSPAGSGTSATAGATRALRERFLERGRELHWHPDYMRHRYENWVGGLNGDWLISRQRFFGVPIPLWYRARRRRHPRLRRPHRPGGGHAAHRPVVRRATRLHRRPAGPARRLRRRPRRDGHLGHLVAHAPDRRPAGSTTPTSSPASSRWTCGPRPTRSSARGCSPPWCAPTSSTGGCRGAMRRCPGGSWIRTARRCPSPRATS